MCGYCEIEAKRLESGVLHVSTPDSLLEIECMDVEAQIFISMCENEEFTLAFSSDLFGDGIVIERSAVIKYCPVCGRSLVATEK